jgi:hypothetical protein
VEKTNNSKIGAKFMLNKYSNICSVAVCGKDFIHLIFNFDE